ncbi:MAG: hypothetical protein IKW52_00190 [Alistipes sp.]|nr:hypothetical protein [Alistipes sp.]
MKKVLMILAACALFAACNSVEREAINRLAEIDAAWKAGNIELAEQLTAEIEVWEKALSDEDKAKVGKAVKKWAEENIFVTIPDGE